MKKYRLTFTRKKGKKMNRYLVSTSEEETERLRKEMYDKGFELTHVGVFKERRIQYV